MEGKRVLRRDNQSGKKQAYRSAYTNREKNIALTHMMAHTCLSPQTLVTKAVTYHNPFIGPLE